MVRYHQEGTKVTLEKNCPHCGQPAGPADNYCASCGRVLGDSRAGRQSKLRDHVVVVAILAAVALVYVAYSAIIPDNVATEQPTSGSNWSGPQPDMQSFLENLPTDFAALVSMGNALMDDSRYELAVQCYTRALEQQPTNPDVRVDLGACQHALGQNEKAIENFMNALERQPDHKIAKFNLGIVYSGLGDTAQALAWWNKLLAENPPPELKSRVETLMRQTGGH